MMRIGRVTALFLSQPMQQCRPAIGRWPKATLSAGWMSGIGFPAPDSNHDVRFGEFATAGQAETVCRTTAFTATHSGFPGRDIPVGEAPLTS